jgi:DNA-binding protein HU-beta
MKLQEMITKTAEVSGLTKKDVENVLRSYTEVVKEGLVQGDEIPMVDGGKFVVVDRAERQGRNPKTQEVMTIPACKSPKFKIGKSLKDLLK